MIGVLLRRHQHHRLYYPGDAHRVHGVANPLCLVEAGLDVPRQDGVDGGDDGQQEVVQVGHEQVGGREIADSDAAASGERLHGVGRRQQDPGRDDGQLQRDQPGAEEELVVGAGVADLEPLRLLLLRRGKVGVENPKDPVGLEKQRRENQRVADRQREPGNGQVLPCS